MRNKFNYVQPVYLLPFFFFFFMAAQVQGQGIKISGGASLKTSGSVHIKVTSTGGVEVDDNSQIILDSQSKLTLGGNLNLHGATTQLEGKILLNGNSSQQISAASEVSVHDLTVSNAGLTLQTAVLVNGDLDLQKGIISTTEQNLLTLGARTSYNGGDNESYINGYFAIRTKAASGDDYNFKFPVGNGGSYLPFTFRFKQTNASSTTYRVAAFTSNIPENALANDVKSISTTKYWQVTNGNLSNFSSEEVILPISTADGISEDEAIVAKTSENLWKNLGGKDVSVPGTVTSSRSFSTVGDFTVATSQLLPAFSITSETLTKDEDFEGTETLTITPSENSPAATYSFSPALNSIELAQISFDAESKTLNISASENANGSAEIQITATDQSNEENTFTRTLTININPVNDAPLVAEEIDDINVSQDADDFALDIFEVFTDPDNETLNISVLSSDNALATATLSENQLLLSFGEGLHGTALITLTAQDAGGATAQLTFNVNVSENSSNTPPVANAGADQTVIDRDNDGSAAVSLDGSASIDPDGNIVSYTWTHTNGEVIATGATPNTGLPIGTYEIVLTVEDNEAATDQDTVVVIVKTESTGNSSITVTDKSIPETFDIGNVEPLLLSLNIEDEDDLSISKFGIKGITSTDEISIVDIVGENGTFSFTQTSAELKNMDPLGIEFEFYFADKEENDTTLSGIIYWEYKETSFQASTLDWKEIGQDTAYAMNDFNIISFPFTSQAVSSVLQGLGTQQDTAWRLFRHQAGTGSEGIEEYGSSFATNGDFDPGRGYFLIMRDRDDIQFGGRIAEMKNVNGYLVHELELQNGWNLIGNPFPYAIDWAHITNHPLNEDNSNTLNAQSLERLRTQSSYSQGTTLKAFEGAFYYWNGDNGAKLYIPTTAKSENTTNRMQEPTPKGGWQIPIVLHQRGISFERAGVGMNPGATEGIDSFDALLVPSIQNHVEFVIDQDAHPMNRSVVPEYPYYQWEATLKGSNRREKVLLQWDSQKVSQLEKSLYIWDEHQNLLVDMSERSSLEVDLAPSIEVPLKILYGSEADVFTNLEVNRLQVSQPYPNPAKKMVTLPLSLPESGRTTNQVSLSLYNSQGQTIGSYNFGKLLPGYHELQFDLPAGKSGGLYHFQLRVEGEQSFYGRILKKH